MTADQKQNIYVQLWFFLFNRIKMKYIYSGCYI